MPEMFRFYYFSGRMVLFLILMATGILGMLLVVRIWVDFSSTVIFTSLGFLLSVTKAFLVLNKSLVVMTTSQEILKLWAI